MPPDSNTISAGAAGATGAIGVSLLLAAFAAARVFLPPRPILPDATSVEEERAFLKKKKFKKEKRRKNRVARVRIILVLFNNYLRELPPQG